MSALPLLEPTVRPQGPVQRSGVAPQRRRQTPTVVRPRPMPRPQVRAIEVLAARALKFCCVAIATFMVSSLVGHVMVEKSRRDGLAALARLRDASKVESVLQEQVYALNNVEAVQAWALQHGFRAPEDALPTGPESTVATLR